MAKRKRKKSKSPITKKEALKIWNRLRKTSAIDISKIKTKKALIESLERDSAKALVKKTTLWEKVHSDRDSKIVKSYKKGTVVRKIADKHGVHTSTVYRILHKKGIELNRSKKK